MHFSWKRWRLPLIATLTALALSLSFAGPAVAAEPGEWGSWTVETVGNQQLEARGTVSEARNTLGQLLQVWRGETNNIVWLSMNDGNPFQLVNPDGSSTATYVSPTVVPFGEDNWMVLHTGTDNNIYYTVVTPNNTWSGWRSVPFQSTYMPVSVAQFGGGSSRLYMVYRSSNDDRVWGTVYDGYGWQGAQQISGGNSPSAPSVAFNPTSSGLFTVVRGEDNQVWMSSSYNGGSSWNSWTAQGGNTIDTPTLAASARTGTMLMSHLDTTYRPNYRQYSAFGSPQGDWSQDITRWQTVSAVFLSVVYGSIYAILTGQNGFVYYKQAFSG
jgi:hypothetical protein